MPEDNNALIPRTGAPVRLIEGPRSGQRSLYQQQVLDEDTYTDALSHIITRDFFPNLPHLHATNAYLTALSTNDPELLSSSIRRLAALAQEKEDGKVGKTRRNDEGEEVVGEETEAERMRRRELEMMGTPYISTVGRGGPSRRLVRTPVGARGWDTPIIRGEGSTRRAPNDLEEYDELDGDPSETPGPSRPKRRKVVPKPSKIRDDLPLDAFQRNYTSEDNASFVHIVDEENKRRREDRWGWAWEAEKKAEMRRLEGEEKRKMILDAATSGNWVVDGNGRRMIGGLAQGGRERLEGEAWKEERKFITGLETAPSAVEGTTSVTLGSDEDKTSENAADDKSLAVVPHQSEATSSALVTTSKYEPAKKTESLAEKALPEDHPLHQALSTAGLPTTALVSMTDGTIVPHREVVSGEGDGRGRGQEERERREMIEKETMGDEKRDTISLGGSGADLWGYKTRNNFYFPADANSDPYPKNRAEAAASLETARQKPKEIRHSNTRLPDEEENAVGSSSRTGSRRGSSPARSWIDAAVKGTPYHPGGSESSMPSINSYPLLPADPSPSPQDLPSLLTWGTLLATPRALDGSNDPLDLSTPSFRMPETKKRDELGRKLADKASRSMNERAKGFTTPRSGYQQSSSLASSLKSSAEKTRFGDKSVRGPMLPPSSVATPKRQAEGLTPAGRRLLERSMGRSPMHSAGGGLGLGGTSSKNRGAAMEKGAGWSSLGAKPSGVGRDVGRMSWTPSPGGFKRA